MSGYIYGNLGGMGGGDLQLMAGASLLLGYKVFIALFIGVFFGAVYGTAKKMHDRKDEKEISVTKSIVSDDVIVDLSLHPANPYQP